MGHFWEDAASVAVPGIGLANYLGDERRKYNEAYNEYGTPSPEELELMEAQVKAAKQAFKDRQDTRSLVFARMGYKVEADKNGKKKLVRLSDEERSKLLSSADKSRTSAAAAYSERAKAAASGTTKLPSFLKKDIDYQKEKETAMLEEMLGPEAMKTTAGQQALAQLTKTEEDVRGRIQDQDLRVAPSGAMGLTSQLEGKKADLIEGYESLPLQGSGLMGARGGLLQQMQQRRLDAYRNRLAELDARRATYTSLLSAGGQLGSLAATKGKPSANYYDWDNV